MRPQRWAILFGVGLCLAGTPAWSEISLLDDASDLSLNAYGQSRSWNGSGGGVINVSYLNTSSTPRPYGGQDHSLAVEYDASAVGAYVYFVDILTGSGDVNLSAYTYVAFWVRGAVGGEGFQVGMSNSSYAEPKVQVNDLLPNGVTPQWQKVVVPFQTLKSKGAWVPSATNKFAVVVDQAALNGAASGTFYLDDITFGTAPAPVWVDTFNDGADPNACNGGNPAFGTNVTAGYDTAHYVSAPRSQRLTYTSVDSSGTFVHFLNDQDLSRCTHLRFQVRVSDGRENLSIRLRDSGGVDHSVALGTYVTPGATFQAVSIPLTDFTSPGNLTRTPECDLDVPSGVTSTAWLDDLVFVDTSIPSAPTSMTFKGAAVGDGDTLNGAGTLGVTSGSVAADAKLEGVKFEWSNDGGTTWTTIGTDYATAPKTGYGTTWDTSTLPEGAYQVRATSHHVGGTSASLSHSVTLSLTPPPTRTVTPILSPTPTSTPTPVLSPTPTSTPTPVLTPTPTATPTPPSVTSTPTPTQLPAMPSGAVLATNSFDPHRGERLEIAVPLSTRGTVRVVIYSRVGDRLKELSNGEAGPGTLRLSWDGRTDAGKTVASGIYVIHFETPGDTFKRLFAVIQ